ncbi:TMEM175 family protein [Methylococcus mesophilus]|uniref:TMEM175 family protein n=1 Tax=Methylococcus mesophilus TaxID=2993564 RepID=UPI00224A7C6F|nr:TMEM175 family protein [Methylococcus mesophilus]UZR29376.1 TMEM175 family protein [Methylococcus mesophilus]
MPHSQEPQKIAEYSLSGLSTGRIEAFSDGVFAIVITLLVIDLKVPEIADDLVTDQLGPRLIELLPKLLSYALSFVIVGVYWVAHHHVFHHVERSDRTLLWLNILFLSSVTFVPFPTALIGEYSDQELAVVIYGINVVVTRLLLLMIWRYATKNHRLVAPGLDPFRVNAVAKLIAIPIGIYAIAIGFSLISTKVTLILYGVVPVVFSILPNVLNRRHPI